MCAHCVPHEVHVGAWKLKWEVGNRGERIPPSTLVLCKADLEKSAFSLYSDLLNTRPSSTQANLFILRSLPLLLPATHLGGLFLTEAEKNVAPGRQQTKITPKNSFPASIDQ